MTNTIEDARPGPKVRERDSRVQLSVTMGAVAVIISLAATVIAAKAISRANGRTASTGGTNAASAPSSVTVHLSEFKLEPTTANIGVGGELNAMNMGKLAHNLAVKNTKLSTPSIDVAGSAPLRLTGLKAGRYTLFCSIAGHEQAGMRATLRVAGRAATTKAAAPVTHTMTAEEMDAAMARSIMAFPAKTAGTGAQVLAPTVLADGTKQFELTSKVVKWEVEPGRLVDAWTYNGTVPGPTLHVNPGDKVKVVIHNELPESTAIHFHGLVTPNAADGVPEITQGPVKPRASYTYSFTAQATPAVGMYHSHQDAVKQVPNGLAGAFLVGQEPLPTGVRVAQEQLMMLNDAGTIGLSINGKSFPATAPYVAKLGDWLEVHYMNEGQLVHPMHLHGLAQRVIAKDGYPLAVPYDADTILVGPGERYTVLVHVDNPGTWAWHCHILSHAEREDGMFGMVTALVVKEG